MSMKQDIKELLNGLLAKGWTLDKGRTHYKARHPKGGMVVISATPSDHRAFANIKGDIKRLERRHEAVKNCLTTGVRQIAGGG